MDFLLIAFTLLKLIVILYGVGKGIKYLFNGFNAKDDVLKIKGLKYAAISVGIVILLSAFEFLILSMIDG